jgi:hypothetical protein
VDKGVRILKEEEKEYAILNKGMNYLGPAIVNRRAMRWWGALSVVVLCSRLLLDLALLDNSIVLNKPLKLCGKPC